MRTVWNCVSRSFDVAGVNGEKSIHFQDHFTANTVSFPMLFFTENVICSRITRFIPFPRHCEAFAARGFQRSSINIRYQAGANHNFTLSHAARLLLYSNR